jgi:hypothetical protein
MTEKKKEQDQPQVTNSVVTVSEERIRQIVREELATWEKQMVQRARFGTPVKYEVK